MIRPVYSKILLIIAFLTIMITLPSAPLMAQTDEERSSVTSSMRSTIEGQPAGESSSVTSSTRSTTEARPARESGSVTVSRTEARPTGEHRCAGPCRERYDASMTECNQPDHPSHKKCEKWAREREKECLDTCYHE